MQVLKMVLDGEVDLGLARSLHHPEVETQSLRDDPLLFVGHPSHRATSKRRMKLQEVESLPLIFYDRGSSDWTLTNGLFRRAGLLPNVVLEVEGIETCKRMVLRRLGLAFLPQLAVTRELKSARLRAIQITDAEPLHRSLDVTSRSAGRRSVFLASCGRQRIARASRRFKWRGTRDRVPD